MLLSVLLIILPSFWFVIGASANISFALHIAIFLGIIGLAVAFSLEYLSRETETVAKIMLLESNNSSAEITQLHEKIRELDRTLLISQNQNDQFRHSLLLPKMNEVQAAMSISQSRILPSQIGNWSDSELVEWAIAPSTTIDSLIADPDAEHSPFVSRGATWDWTLDGTDVSEYLAVYRIKLA